MECLQTRIFDFRNGTGKWLFLEVASVDVILVFRAGITRLAFPRKKNI